MRGTASDSYRLSDLFVPEAFSTTREEPELRRERGPLYAFTMQGLYAVGVSGVAIGIARAMQKERSLTQDGLALGTEHYTAPEQGMGHPEPASDIYSMGVVAYQMLTGLLPFQDLHTLNQLLYDSNRILSARSLHNCRCCRTAPAKETANSGQTTEYAARCAYCR